MKYMQYFLFQRMGRLFIACFIPCSIWLGFPKASPETQLALLVFGGNTAVEQPLDGKSDVLPTRPPLHAFTCREGRAG